MHVVVGQDLAHGVDACLDSGLVVGGRVLAEQVLQHVGRHDGIALDGPDQVLAHDDTWEEPVDLAVQLALHRRSIDWRVGREGFFLADLTHLAHGCTLL